MKCPHCGAEVPSTTKFCEFCGSQITAEMQKEREALNKEGCPKCGSTNITYNREKKGEVYGKKHTAVVRSTVGLCKDCGYTWQANDNAGSRKTLLWVLGWIFIFPVPLTILLLRNQKMKKALKIALIAAAWAVFILIVVAVNSNNNNKKEKAAASAATTAAAVETVPDLQTVLAPALEEFQNGGYVYIMAEDLQTYCANLAGTRVYTVTEVSDVMDDRVQCTLADGFMMSNFYSSVNYGELLRDDDTIAVFGEVADYDNYGGLGTSVNLENCKVFAVGKDAQAYKQEASDPSLADKLVVTGAVAATLDPSSFSKEEYVALCKDLSYSDILRNPDNYKAEFCYVKGRVDQSMEGFFDTFTLYIMDSNGNKWECSYRYHEGENRVLEGDYVTVYGKCTGTTTSTTVLGKQVTMPKVELEYIN